ncbi:MAG: right-handed parallel beta-helix repeat-containing protein, partial [Herminiimonas sp.]|nr:right-handed parallel beta-helix repeat-containing protein [Herminiimonas sp.]
MNRAFYPSVLITLTLAACGGGGGSSDGMAPASEAASVTAATSTSVTPATATDTPATTAVADAPVPTSVQPVPTNIASGATVSLQCGQTYYGTLELNGKSNVTVNTTGTCGPANITPGKAVTGWTQYQGNIYSAPIDFTPVQVSVAGKPVDAAHWPNRPQIWATDPASVPNSDLAGANLVYLANQSVIQSQTISGNAVSASTKFYVEGKLWMLDNPGEWAVSNGRIYLWAPDGQSPEGRAWAA